MTTTAIVTGISGQDGFYMAQLLLAQQISVIGLTSDLERAERELKSNGCIGVTLMQFDYAHSGNFTAVVADVRPDMIFNFAAKATGLGMFDSPIEMNRVNATLVLDILEAIRTSGRNDNICFCQASSSEMYGNVTETPQTENTSFRPKSPYGAAKLYAHNMINIYRAAYSLRCCSAILYNHESVRRSMQFVTRKIAHGAAAVKRGRANHLLLGALDISRDWGYAPEYVRAMYLMASADEMKDYVVATGRATTVRHLCEIAFGHVGLDYAQYVRIDAAGRRVTDSLLLQGDPTRIAEDLGWRALRTIEQTIVELVDYEMGMP